MGTETITYTQLSHRHRWPEAVRTLTRRLRLPGHRAEDGKVCDGSDASLNVRIGELETQLAKAEASAASHRADFERERERCDRLTLELIRAAVETMNAKETAARLEGELSVLRSRRWWKPSARQSLARDSWIAVLFAHVRLNRPPLFARVPHVSQTPRNSAAPR
jgi:hypothetical protein